MAGDEAVNPSDDRKSGPRLERLRTAVEAAGGAGAVARLSGVPKSTISGYIAGGEMKLTTAEAIASATGTRLEWLATGQGPMMAREAEASGMGLAPTTSNVVAVPRYDARAGADRAGKPAEEMPIIQRVEFSEAWLRTKLRRDPRDLVLLEVVGDSMEPTIGQGDVLMIDCSVHDLTTGRIYVLDLGGEMVVKRIQRRATGGLLILSDNTRYPPEEIPPAEAPLRVLGEVVWHARTL